MQKNQILERRVRCEILTPKTMAWGIGGGGAARMWGGDLISEEASGRREAEQEAGMLLLPALTQIQ